jgi:hypothetical protein
MKIKTITFTLFLCSILHNILAQETATQKRDEKTLERNYFGNRYRMVNNYINFGIGYARAIGRRESFPVGIGYNFHIKKTFFQLGYNRSEMPILWGSYTRNFLNDLHFAFCIRNETRVFNVAYVMGVGKVWGLKDNIGFNTFSAYAEAQLIRKIYYDVGVGLNLFVNYNREYPTGGIRLDFFLSSSFQGKINSQ